MEEVSRGKQAPKKLLSMMQEGEGKGEVDNSSAWEDDDDDDSSHPPYKNLVAADSYDEIGSENDHVSRKRKRKRIINVDEYDEDIVKPEDYPELGKFLKYDLMNVELKEKWRVIGNENARMLQKEWIEIMKMQVELSLGKTSLIEKMYSLIEEEEEEEEEEEQQQQQQQQSKPNAPS